MPAWGSWSFLFGPVVAFAAVGVLALLLRWGFSGNTSLVQRRPRRGTPQEYGLLVAVATPPTYVEAELIRRHLGDAGLRATVAPTSAGPAVMVFPRDAAAARELVARRPWT